MSCSRAVVKDTAKPTDSDNLSICLTTRQHHNLRTKTLLWGVIQKIVLWLQFRKAPIKNANS